MIDEKPLVSCIIPVYNGERYLAEAIESVRAQTYRPIEVIVVDDGSTDGSADIAQSYDDARYIYQPNQGVAVSRNTGIAAAQGDYVAFLDQDDRWTPDKLSVQMGYLLEHSHVDYVLARQRMFLEAGGTLPSWVRPGLLEGEPLGFLGTLVARKTVFERIGNFDPAYQVTTDADWFFRAKDAGISMTYLDEVLLHKRIHSDNESRRARLNNVELLRIARVSIKRQCNQAPPKAQ
jgi:glycosyltransferase involved in cell wall biosynthesis